MERKESSFGLDKLYENYLNREKGLAAEHGVGTGEKGAKSVCIPGKSLHRSSFDYYF